MSAELKGRVVGSIGAGGMPPVPTPPTLAQLMDVQLQMADELMRLHDRVQTLAGQIDLPSFKVDPSGKVNGGGQLQSALERARTQLTDLREINSALTVVV